MKQILGLLMLMFSAVALGQTGTIEGTLSDKETNNEPLPFANVIIKGTTKGATTDFDGKYIIENVPVGTYEVEFSFVGYEPVTVPNVVVQAGKFTNVSTALGASAAALDEVVIQVQTSRERESALLLEQKKALTLETAIGAQELARKGVSDAAAAVSKVTGISKAEGSGSVFVRGLGDRYNITTMNNLPLPSNNTSRKNIDLDLFGSNIIEAVGIDKTFNAQNYGDFGGANINISSKSISGKGFFEISLGSGLNTVAAGQDSFYLPDGANYTGFYNKEVPGTDIFSSNNFGTSWDRQDAYGPAPVNFDISLQGGDAFDIGEEGRLDFFVTGTYENKYSFREGVNRGGLQITTGTPRSDLDYTSYGFNTNTTLYGNVGYRQGKTKLDFNSLYLNNTQDKLDEFNGVIDLFDNAQEGGGFIQRGTFERTQLFVNQLLGAHDLNEQWDVNWGVSYNALLNVVPDRKQTTLLPTNSNQPDGPKSFRLISAASDNHRFFQELNEDEISANLSTSYNFKKNDEEEYDATITVGYNGRFKNVDFEAIQFNYQILNINQQPTIDPRNIDAYFNENGVSSGLYQLRTFRGPESSANALEPQTYGGNQQINAGYVTLKYNFSEKFTLFAGFRGEQINQFIEWNTITQAPGDTELSTFEYLPSISLKYALNDKQNLRFAASKTYTLPQFKERAPFLFQEDINNDSFGNPFLKNSTNYNVDLRWELFPKSSELISFGVFGKLIENPINTYLVLSAANDISYANTGDQATAYGAELEVRLDLIESEITRGDAILSQKFTFGTNLSYLNSNQELSSEKVTEETNQSAAFTNTEAPLQGASDFIANGDITYFREFSESSNLSTTLVANYFSDRIYALGSAGRGHLVDKGFVTLDWVTRFQLNDKIELGLSFGNLLNPTVKRIQDNAEGKLDRDNPANTGFFDQGPIDVLSYNKGVDMSLGFTYKF